MKKLVEKQAQNYRTLRANRRVGIHNGDAACTQTYFFPFFRF